MQWCTCSKLAEMPLRLGNFLCRFDAAWFTPQIERAKKAFAESGGGRFGVTGVASIELTGNAARRDALSRLLAPAAPGSVSPAIVVAEGQRYQLRSVTVKCKEPEKAKTALPPGLRVLFTR